MHSFTRSKNASTGVTLAAWILFSTFLLLSIMPTETAKAQQSNEETLEDIRDLAEKLEDIKNMAEELEDRHTDDYELLWARMAYRCGNADNAIEAWVALAKKGNERVKYILSLLHRWATSEPSGRELYAWKVFYPGDGSSDVCQSLQIE